MDPRLKQVDFTKAQEVQRKAAKDAGEAGGNADAKVVDKASAKEALKEAYAGTGLDLGKLDEFVDDFADADTPDGQVDAAEFAKVVARANQELAPPAAPSGPSAEHPQAPPQDNPPVTPAALKAATQAVNDAQGQVDKLNTELASDLARLGPGATPQQVEEFRNAFVGSPAYKDATAKLKERQDGLADTLRRNEVLADAFCRDNRTKDKEAILDAFKALGKTNVDVTRKFAEGVLNNPDALKPKPGLFEEGGGLPEKSPSDYTNMLIDELVTPNIGAFSADLAAKYPGHPEKAAAELDQGLVKSLETLAKSGKEGKAVKDKASALAGSLHEATDIFTKTTDKRLDDQLKKFLGDAKDAGTFKRVAGAAAIAFGVSAAGDELEHGKFGEAIRDFSCSAANATELLSSLSCLEKFAKVGVRLAPALNCISAGVAAVVDTQAFFKDGDATHLVAAGGDLMAVTGAALVFTVGTAGIGPALLAVGGIVALGASTIMDAGKNAKEDAARVERFVAAMKEVKHPPVSETVATMLAKEPPGALEKVKACYHLSDEDFISLIQDRGQDLGKLPSGGVGLDRGFVAYAQTFLATGGKIDGSKVAAFLASLPNGVGAANLLSVVNYQGTPPQNKEQWISALQDRIKYIQSPGYKANDEELKDCQAALELAQRSN